MEQELKWLGLGLCGISDGNRGCVIRAEQVAASVSSPQKTRLQGTGTRSICLRFHHHAQVSVLGNPSPTSPRGLSGGRDCLEPDRPARIGQRFPGEHPSPHGDLLNSVWLKLGESQKTTVWKKKNSLSFAFMNYCSWVTYLFESKMFGYPNY